MIPARRIRRNVCNKWCSRAQRQRDHLESRAQRRHGLWQEQAAYIAAEDSDGKIPTTAGRLEFYSINPWANSIAISYVDGCNIAMTVDDGMGNKIGSLQSIAHSAPPAALIYDTGGHAAFIGWHDGNNIKGRIGAAYIQRHISSGSAFVHPDDTKNASCNPTRLGYNQSHNFHADVSNSSLRKNKNRPSRIMNQK